jgi:hypothetical protein
MAWFGDRLLRRGPFRGKSFAQLNMPAGDAGNDAESTPGLIVLVPDAYGRASYQAHHFPEIEPASEFVQYWYRANPPSGLIAFWALTWEPAAQHQWDSDAAAEPLVLIRDEQRPGTVYPFSFVDISSAHSFIRQEARWAVDLARVSVYWALPVAVEATSDGAYRLRGEPPRQRAGAQAAPTSGVSDQAAQSATFEEEPIGRVVRPAPFAPPAQEPDALDDPATSADDAADRLSWRAAETEAAENGNRWARPAASDAPDDKPAAETPGPLQPTLPVNIQGAPEAVHPDPSPESGAASGSPDPIDAECVSCLVAEVESSISAASDHDTPRLECDICHEVRKVLHRKRWDEQDEPFRGFDSPPGRF